MTPIIICDNIIICDKHKSLPITPQVQKRSPNQHDIRKRSPYKILDFIFWQSICTELFVTNQNYLVVTNNYWMSQIITVSDVNGSQRVCEIFKIDARCIIIICRINRLSGHILDRLVLLKLKILIFVTNNSDLSQIIRHRSILRVCYQDFVVGFAPPDIIVDW